MRSRSSGPMRFYLRLALYSLACCSRCVADEYSHKYEIGEALNLWVNKVGPYHNPQETYLYYSLPFCTSKPVDELKHRWDGLGEVLEGNDLISSGLDLQFRVPVTEHTKLCTVTLSEASAQQLQYAVHNHYW